VRQAEFMNGSEPAGGRPVVWWPEPATLDLPRVHGIGWATTWTSPVDEMVPVERAQR
jgi:hypothetical protein